MGWHLYQELIHVDVEEDVEGIFSGRVEIFPWGVMLGLVYGRLGIVGGR